MLSIREYISESAHPETEEEDQGFTEYFYAILIDEASEKIYVSEYSNIFLLLDLVLQHPMLSKLTIYRTQHYPPSIRQLQDLQSTILGQ
jgi:hypothetical protein